MKILKFGGTSASKPQKIIEIIKSYKDVVVVLSAFSGITNKLIDAANLAAKKDDNYLGILKEIKNTHLSFAKKLKISDSAIKIVKENLKELEETLRGIYLIKENSTRTMDLIMSFGERLSTHIISHSIKNAEQLDSRKLLKTNNNFGYAKLNFSKTYENIQKHFKKSKKLQIITGFIASTEDGETTTLGRGGSDYTASIFAAALNSEEIEIWTDVDGIMTTDPRVVKKSLSIKNISYIEAMEMSHFGTKVIHPPTMQPALNKNIPIRIKNTLNPEFEGSVISSKTSSALTVKGISTIKDIALLRVQGGGMVGITGISRRLFGSLARAKINIILITQASSEHSICFVIKLEESKKAKKAIDEEFELEIEAKKINEVIIEKDLSIIAIIGENMRHKPGVSGKMFQALGQNGINVVAIAQGSSELNISAVILNKDTAKAINALHDSFFLSGTKSLNLFIIGATGLIGSTLIKQIEKEKDRIRKDQKLNIKIVGLANSKKMAFNEEGVTLKNLKEESSIENFVKNMRELNIPNSIFVDCTASEEVLKKYPEILKASISISTPNKKANSSNLHQYTKLALAASKSTSQFLYETNVGAGLPVLSTLNDLLHSGDKIEKIEAVLSGTLSYIFNSYDGSIPFSEVVKKAKVKGYTEPDPRDDLNGIDVARKLLILARETGQMLELKDIDTENLVPEKARSSKSVEEFFTKLKKEDTYFESIRDKAAKNNKKLCYIATLEKNKAYIRLESIGQNHPFYSLSGSDNIVSFTTNRYKNTPLVIKGPGAGAEVTAAGVFADILRISNTSFDGKIAHGDFIKKLKKKKLIISLIGMSNIGKTFWSKKLTKLGFKHINCDNIIEEKLGPKLKERGYQGIEDVAKWLGQPHEKQFKKNEAQYLKLEKETMNEIFQNISAENQNIVIDTTGSIVHIESNILEDLKKHSLVIYLETPEEMKKEMYENFIAHPKPLIWKDNYKDNDLAKSYLELLENRSTLYKEHADLTIPFHQIAENNLNETEFLNLIEENL